MLHKLNGTNQASLKEYRGKIVLVEYGVSLLKVLVEKGVLFHK